MFGSNSVTSLSLSLRTEKVWFAQLDRIVNFTLTSSPIRWRERCIIVIWWCSFAWNRSCCATWFRVLAAPVCTSYLNLFVRLMMSCTYITPFLRRKMTNWTCWLWNRFIDRLIIPPPNNKVVFFCREMSCWKQRNHFIVCCVLCSHSNPMII